MYVLNWKYIVYFLPIYVTCQNAEQEIDICEQQDGTIARLVHVTNPTFPGSEVSTNTTCQCNISGGAFTATTDLWVSVSRGHVGPLTLRYGDSMPGTRWLPHAGHGLGPGGNKMVIVENVTFLHVAMDTYSTAYSVLLFRLDITAVDVINITCWVTPHDTGSIETGGGDETSTNTAMAYIADLCSPHLLIILGSLSFALLLIILPLAIVVCCYTPSRRQKYEVELRNRENVENHSRTTSNNSGNLLYDDAIIKMCSSGSYTAVDDRRPSNEMRNERRARFRRSNSVPGRYTRQSEHHYANTMDMAN